MSALWEDIRGSLLAEGIRDHGLHAVLDIERWGRSLDVPLKCVREPKRRRAKRRSLGKRMREEILITFGYRCLICERTERLCIDHVYPVSRGGSSRFENLQVLCETCNARKHDKVLL